MKKDQSFSVLENHTHVSPVLRSPKDLDRRNFLKNSFSLGAGTWLVAALSGSGLSPTGNGLKNRALADEFQPEKEIALVSGEFELPALPYDYDALEPVIDKETMTIHHTKHHQAYVNGLNAVVADHSELAGKSIEELLRGFHNLPPSAQNAVRNSGGGHHNHTLFWQVMRPASQPNLPNGRLGQMIDATFESFDKFKQVFNQNALTQFGSGWSWLVVSEGKLELMKSPNQDSPLMEGKTPILGIDVWEHAYYLKYQNRRADYVNAWWDLVNWAQVAENLEDA
jgi:Fe-Mn family superoxide dismutase